MLKIAFPHLGYCAIPLRAMLARLGHEVVVPPPISRKTIDLGTRYGPEFACYPLKLGLATSSRPWKWAPTPCSWAAASDPAVLVTTPRFRRKFSPPWAISSG